jgi:hypothetical protein
MKLAPWNIVLKSLIFGIFVITIYMQSSDTFAMFGDNEKELEDTRERLKSLKDRINEEIQSIDYDEYYIFAAYELKNKWVEDLKTCRRNYVKSDSDEGKSYLLNCELVKTEYWSNLVEKLQDNTEE